MEPLKWRRFYLVVSFTYQGLKFLALNYVMISNTSHVIFIRLQFSLDVLKSQSILLQRVLMFTELILWVTVDVILQFLQCLISHLYPEFGIDLFNRIQWVINQIFVVHNEEWVFVLGFLLEFGEVFRNSRGLVSEHSQHSLPIGCVNWT